MISNILVPSFVRPVKDADIHLSTRKELVTFKQSYQLEIIAENTLASKYKKTQSKHLVDTRR